MTVRRKRASLALLLALSTWGRSDQLLGQEPRNPIGVLLTFVREDVRKAVPPEMKPYEIGRIFLRVAPRAPGRDILGPLEQANLERLGVTLVDDRWADMLVATDSGHHVRDDGVYVDINSVERVGDTRFEGAVAITFSYYVTWRRPGTRSTVCLQEWRILQRPAGAGWEIVEAASIGKC